MLQHRAVLLQAAPKIGASEMSRSKWIAVTEMCMKIVTAEGGPSSDEV